MSKISNKFLALTAMMAASGASSSMTSIRRHDLAGEPFVGVNEYIPDKPKFNDDEIKRLDTLSGKAKRSYIKELKNKYCSCNQTGGKNGGE